MINGLGVLGWGVGGIEAEACMLGQPISMLLPPVVGFKLHGKLRGRLHRHRPGADRHPDAAQEGRGRQVRRVLRRRPERAEPGRPRHRRQHGARIRRHHGLLPGGRRRPCDYLRSPTATPTWSRWWKPTPRSRACSAPTPTPDPLYADTLELDLATVVPSMAGPKRPQDRVELPDVRKNFHDAFRAAPRKARRSQIERRSRRTSRAARW